MSFSDIKNPTSIRRAMQEFDELGRERFLHKYGFREARDYFVRAGGKLYDSKAIVGAAHGFEFPDKDPLTPDMFAGGRNTVAPFLEELGFEVVYGESEESAAEPTADPRPDANVWVVRSGVDGRDEADIRRLSVIAFGGSELGDLAVLGSKEAILERQKETSKGENPRTVATWASQHWRFLSEIQEGDIALTPLKGTQDVLLGVVTGHYEFAPDRSPRHPHVRSVEWQRKISRDSFSSGARVSMRSRLSIFSLSQHSDEMRRLLSGKSPLPDRPPSTPRVEQPDQEERTIWWVNQGKSYEWERDGGYIWASVETESGAVVEHHENVSRVSPGDTVLHYVDGEVRAVGMVLGDATRCPRPDGSEMGSEGEGHHAPIKYFELEEPIPLEELPERAREHVPFTSSGGVRQGYFFAVPGEYAAELREALQARWPAGSPMSDRPVWVFQANPRRWPIFDFLDDAAPGTELGFTVTRYRDEMQVGDPAVMWASGPNAGAYAFATIIAPPQPRDDHNEFGRIATRLRIDNILATPLLRAGLVNHPILSRTHVIKSPQGSNFKMSREEWTALLLMAAGTDPSSGDPAQEQPEALPAGVRAWVISPGPGARLWSQFLSEGIIALGSDYLGDLRDYTDKASLTEAIRARRGGEIEPTNDALARWQFVHEMKVGDFVFAKKGFHGILGCGVIDSDYDFDESRSEFQHVRGVRWLTDGKWMAPEDARLPTKTMTEVTAYPRFLAFALPLMRSRLSLAVREEPRQVYPTYTVDTALKDLFLAKDEFQGILDALANKKNIILQGPPGVGKTFMAKRLAYALIERADPTKVETVQFHQSYAYEDFIQGWRPTEDGGFFLRDGVFYQFCRRATGDTDSDAKYVFIIDEINRGNLSKILGELMMLIEADKRGEEFSVPLTYARDEKERFFVPENLHVIGMMNTADRSLAMVDYALRRRFTFVDLRPRFDDHRFREFLLERSVEGEIVDRIIERMQALNEVIRAEKTSLGPGFEIGHSFFCPRNEDDELGAEWYESIVRFELGPLLREYWFDAIEKAEEHEQRLLG